MSWTLLCVALVEICPGCFNYITNDHLQMGSKRINEKIDARTYSFVMWTYGTQADKFKEANFFLLQFPDENPLG